MPHDSERASDAAPSTAPKTDSLVFRPSPEASLGVEIELQILDKETGNLAPGAVRILKACREEGLTSVTAELMQSMIEVKTGICGSVNEVKEQLIPDLRKARNIAASLGFDLALSGTHPFHRTQTSVVFPEERYAAIQDRLAWITYQRVVFGLHVHVGVPSGDLALGAMNMLVQYLPHLLATSANSPFWQGVDTGLASSRAVLYGLLPHAGVPRHFRTWKEFRTYCHVMQDSKAMRSFKDIYWDIRPRPDLGTLEFRICDSPPSLAWSLGIAALTRSLVVSALKLLMERPQLRRGDIRKHWIAVENKWLAARYGLDAMYIRTPGGKRRVLRRDLGELLEKLKPTAETLGDAAFLSTFQPVAELETGAARQRRLYREKGDWRAVMDDMICRLSNELGK